MPQFPSTVVYWGSFPSPTAFSGGGEAVGVGIPVVDSLKCL